MGWAAVTFSLFGVSLIVSVFALLSGGIAAGSLLARGSIAAVTSIALIVASIAIVIVVP
jgi:hypothetical protein